MYVVCILDARSGNLSTADCDLTYAWPRKVAFCVYCPVTVLTVLSGSWVAGDGSATSNAAITTTARRITLVHPIVYRGSESFHGQYRPPRRSSSATAAVTYQV